MKNEQSDIFRPSSLDEERDVIRFTGTIMGLINQELSDEVYYTQDDPKVREFIQRHGIDKATIDDMAYVDRNLSRQYVQAMLGVKEEEIQVFTCRLRSFIQAARHKPHGLGFFNRR